MHEVANRRKLARRLLSKLLASAFPLLLLGCGGTSPPEVQGAAPIAAIAADSGQRVEAAPSGALEIHAVELREGAPGVQLEVLTSGPLVWTSFRDDEGNLVVELPNSVPSATVAGLNLKAGMVDSAAVEVEENGDRPLTRLVVRTNTETEHSVAADGARLLVDLIPVGETWADVGTVTEPEASATVAAVTSPGADPLAGVGEEYEAPAPETFEIESVTAAMDPLPWDAAVGTASEPVAGPQPSGVTATQLLGVDVSTDGGATVIQIRGDGEFSYTTFALADPDRFVIDLKGVVKTAAVSAINVGDSVVERVRVAQFKPQPDLVSRVVVDLGGLSVPAIASSSDGLTLTFQIGSAPATTLVDDVAAAAEPEMTLPEPEMTLPEPVVTEVAMEDAAPAEMEEPAAMAEEVVAEAEVELEDLGEFVEEAEIEAPAMPAAEAVAAYDPPPAYEPQPEEMVAEAAPLADDWQQSAPEVRVEYEPEPAPRAPEPQASSDLSLYTNQVEIDSGGDKTPGAFEAQTVGGDRRTYEGEPITMSLKDADIKDVLRSFAQISGLNVVVQPGVSGTVTVELVDVPWDQALEQVLKVNGLDYQLEGNIMRVAPIRLLRAEAEQQQKLREAQALSIPLRTIIRRISYASAGEIAGVLRQGGGASIMSRRGSVVVDNRTNTLIIKELPSFINTVIAVIENLDIPEPQVSIEARIIETTKRFSSTLGIQWGFQGISDPTLGNSTGLVFPNNGTVDGGVQLLTGGRNGFLDISMGNVLNSFRLDIALQAAENEGLINILSAPKITTLNNEQASIQSGLQIPIQTIANNTVSVQFVNATLRLDVTPHVTAEGTVLMDINIQKREPQLAFAVVGASNAPIATKDARTRVIVRDGGTTVIGGIYEVTTDQGEDRVPGLANIPIIKHLFKNKRRNDENEELLIFITPRVVKL